MYQIIGDCLIRFMREKPEPYLKNALSSQQNFWEIPAWKRAITFVFIVRFVLGFKAHRQWKKFNLDDLKLNKRAFKRWLEKEEDVMGKSLLLAELDEFKVGSPVSRARKRLVESVSDTTTDSPMKRRYVVNDDSTSDSE